MACRRVGLIGFTFVLAAALLPGAIAETFVVADTAGWNTPSNGNDIYSTWAAGKNFKVGDNLIFNFITGVHDVTEVSKANYDGCGKANPISTVPNGPANVSLTTAGDHYFICTFDGHCSAGQKLVINVNSGSSTGTPPAATSPPGTPTTPNTTSSPPPPGTPTTPTTTSSPPPPSSASSITFGGFSMAILSIVLLFLH